VYASCPRQAVRVGKSKSNKYWDERGGGGGGEGVGSLKAMHEVDTGRDAKTPRRQDASKETYYSVKRDLSQCQKIPVTDGLDASRREDASCRRQDVSRRQDAKTRQKRPITVSKDACVLPSPRRVKTPRRQDA